MIRHLRGLGTLTWSLAAFLVLTVLPAASHAETLAFRNDTGAPIIVQAACVVQGGVQRDRPHLLQPNEACRIGLSGNKLITVYNPKMPNQVLFQTTIPAGNDDLYFSLRYDQAQGKVVLERVKPPPPR